MPVVVKLWSPIPRILRIKTLLHCTPQLFSTRQSYPNDGHNYHLLYKPYHFSTNPNLLRLEFCDQHRNFSTSHLKLKHFDVKKLERYNIYDPNGNYVISSEIYNVEKFCEHFKRYTTAKMENSIGSKGEDGLKSIMILEKPHKDNKDRAKMVKMKSTDAPWVLEKVKRLLIDHGLVNLDIQGKQAKSVRRLLDKEWISQICSISTIQEDETKIYLRITMPDSLDSAHFKQIFTEYTSKDSSYLHQMRDMLEETDESAK